MSNESDLERRIAFLESVIECYESICQKYSRFIREHAPLAQSGRASASKDTEGRRVNAGTALPPGADESQEGR